MCEAGSRGRFLGKEDKCPPASAEDNHHLLGGRLVLLPFVIFKGFFIEQFNTKLS